MTGLGTILNTAAVVAGGLIGLGLKNGIRQKMVPIFIYQGAISPKDKPYRMVSIPTFWGFKPQL